MEVPFLDLGLQYQSIKSEIDAVISEVIVSEKYIQGPFVEKFEREFCKNHGSRFAVGCANGSSAITVALRSLGVGPGDEVITSTNTFFATLEGIHEVGAQIVLVDCDPHYYGVTAEGVAAKITKKTRAIIPVHLYGHPCDMPAIMEVARAHDLLVIEDCAQAHLGVFAGKAVGTYGNIGTFSFYPGKNLGAYGDAGLIVTEDEKLCELLKMHVNHGRKGKYEHEFLAGNFRMDGLQAAILNVKLKYLNEWTEARRSVARKYDEVLKAKGFKVLTPLEVAKCVYHLYVVEVQNRAEVQEKLGASGISTGVHYPIPMHLQSGLKHLGHKVGDFPVSEKACDRMLSLPIFPEITDAQIQYVLEHFLSVAQP